MKLIKLILFLILMSPVCAFAQDDVYKTLDFNKYDITARKILFNYILEDCKENPKAYRDIKKKGESIINAYQIDLNDDGVNEIVGFCRDFGFRSYWGDLNMFILVKTNKGYSEIAPIVVTGDKIIVLNKKTNGYKNIKVKFYNYDKKIYQTTEIRFDGKYYDFI